MKKPLFLTILLLTLLCSCGEKTPTVYDVTRDGTVFIVDRANRTITQGETVYHYQIAGGDLTITYPNGDTYRQSCYTGGVASVTAIYGPPDGPPDPLGETLVSVLAREWPPRETRASRGSPFLGFLCMALGTWAAISPKTAWAVSYGWRYKDAEPSDIALYVERAGGIAALVIGLVLIFS